MMQYQQIKGYGLGTTTLRALESVMLMLKIKSGLNQPRYLYMKDISLML